MPAATGDFDHRASTLSTTSALEGSVRVVSYRWYCAAVMLSTGTERTPPASGVVVR